MELDLREMTFQNVLDTVLKPAGVKVGGFPPEMFKELADSEVEEWKCNICFLVVNDTRQCDNKHLFCHTCVFAWSMTYGENSQKCPMCRCDQAEYAPNKDIDRQLQDKRVHCLEEGCSFKSPLKIYLMHSHGKLKFSNSHLELESLRPRRPHGARLLVLPSLGMAGPGANGPQRGTLIRHQLQQGRVMIHQMMMLLNLEMQLRQQSLVSFQRAAEPTVRVQRLDEVLALNEQLNEVGTILSTLLQSPMTGPSAQLLRDEPAAASAFSVGHEHSPLSRVSNLMRQLDDDEDDNDTDSDSDTSSDSSQNESDIAANSRPSGASQNVNSVLDRSPVSSLEQTLSDGQAALERARERREVSRQILSQSQIIDNDSSRDSILMGRQPGTIPRVGQMNRSQERNVLSTENNDSASGGNRSSVGNPTPNSVVRISTNSTTRPSSSTSSGVQSGNQPEPAALPQLPALENTGHTMHSTSDALRTIVPDSEQPEASTPSPTPSSPAPTGPIPHGSLALRQAMNSMSRSTTPNNNGNRLSIDTNPLAGSQSPRSSAMNDPGIFTTSQASSLSQRRSSTGRATPSDRTTTTQTSLLALSNPASSGSTGAARPQSPSIHAGARGRSPSTGHTSQATPNAPTRSHSHSRQNTGSPSNRGQVNQSLAASPVTSTGRGGLVPGHRSQGAQGSDRTGAILPAALYRRRERPGSSTQANSSNSDSGSNFPAAPGHTPTIRTPSQQANTNQTSSTRAPTRNPREPRSMSNGARQRTLINAEQSNSKQPSPTRRTNLSRRNPLPNRPIINRQTSTQSQQSDSGISSLSSESSAVRTGILGTSRIRPTVAHLTRGEDATLPRLPDGSTRSRRRSEIHKNLVMKK